MIGEFASLTGKEATFGTSSHEGTVLAIEEINAAGGVLGKKIELITEDNQSKAGEPANVVNKLISQDGVVAILGEVASSRSLEAAPICQQNKIPMISPASTNPKVTETGDYIFRVCFIDPFQGTVMANFADEDAQGEEGRRLHRREERLQQGPREVLQGRLRARRAAQIAAELDFNGGDKDFKGQLTAIKGAASGRGLRARLLHRRRAHLHPGQATRPERPALRRRRLGEREAAARSARTRWKGTISPPTTRRTPASPKVTGVRRRLQEALQRQGARRDGRARLRLRHDPRRCDQARRHHRRPEAARRARRHQGLRRRDRQDHDQRQARRGEVRGHPPGQGRQVQVSSRRSAP